MTMPRYYAMCDYWREIPPLHIAVAAFIGVKPPTKQDSALPEFLTLPEFEE